MPCRHYRVAGIGKSTTIDVLGMALIAKGNKVAVLAVDPSRHAPGLRILGDKTRMARLSAGENAFIRPSPSSWNVGRRGGQNPRGNAAVQGAWFRCRRAGNGGHPPIQNHCDMTDFFLALRSAGAGDELQGIKKGLVELADMIAVNKADGDNLKQEHDGRR